MAGKKKFLFNIRVSVIENSYHLLVDYTLAISLLLYIMYKTLASMSC